MVIFQNEVRVAKMQYCRNGVNACGRGLTRTFRTSRNRRNADGTGVGKNAGKVHDCGNARDYGITRTLQGEVRAGAEPQISALPHLPHPLLRGRKWCGEIHGAPWPPTGHPRQKLFDVAAGGVR
jgi:hypothetical protein